jgi:hypothetical protein
MATDTSYRTTQRYRHAVAAFLREASQDPTLVAPVAQAKATIGDSAAKEQSGGNVAGLSNTPYSLIYHETLADYVQQLSGVFCILRH